MKPIEFLSQIALNNRLLKSVFDESVEFWGSDLPYSSAGALGQAICTHFEDLSKGERTKVFAMIETAFSSQKAFGDLANKGLIEPLATEAAHRDKWDTIRSHLGPVSRKHADEWLASFG